MSVFSPVRRRVERQRHAQGANAGGGPISPLDLMTPAQVALATDPAKFKAGLWGRRSGKTIGVGLDFVDGMQQVPGSLNLYVALTMTSAREILWEPLKALNVRHGWGLRFNDTLMVVTYRNGSRLMVRGADDRNELEKLRGMKFHKIRIDECGAMKPANLRYLVEEVLEATLMDSDGDVWLLGTPTAQCFGYFYDITTGTLPGYSVHHSTAKDNPHVNFHRFVYGPGGLLERRNWTEDNPIFRREYLAEWVVDNERLVFRFARPRNVIEALPELRQTDRWYRTLALDFGVNDATACVRLASPRLYGRAVYVERSWGRRGLAPSQAADLIAQEIAEWSPDIVVGDSGGIGKAYLQEFSRRYPGLKPIIPAEKSEKRAALELTSDALFTASLGKPAAMPAGHDIGQHDIGQHHGLFLLHDWTAELQRQLATLQWDEFREDIADGQDDDEAMGMVYGFRRMNAFRNATRPTLPDRTGEAQFPGWAPPTPPMSDQQRNLLEGWLPK